MRALGRVVLLVALWLLAWGDISLGNVVSGIAVALALLVAFPLHRPAGGRVRLRPLGILRLGGYVVAQLVTSNLVMARELLRRRPRVRPGVLAHRLQQPSEVIVTVMTSVIALSPGTMTVEVEPDSSTVYVHFLFLTDVAAAHRALTRLERLAVRAITATPGPEVPSHAPVPTKEAR